jgi:hypothetical protein
MDVIILYKRALEESTLVVRGEEVKYMEIKLVFSPPQQLLH